MDKFDFDLSFSGICLFEFNQTSSTCTVRVPSALHPDAIFHDLHEDLRPYPHSPRLAVPSRHLAEIDKPTRLPDETRPDGEGDEIAIFNLAGDDFELITTGGALKVQSGGLHGFEHTIGMGEFLQASDFDNAMLEQNRVHCKLTFSSGDLSVRELGKIKGKEIEYSFESLLGTTNPPPKRKMAEVCVLQFKNLSEAVIFQPKNALSPPIAIGAEDGTTEVKASFTNIHSKVQKNRKAIYDFLWYYSIYTRRSAPPPNQTLVIPFLPTKMAGPRTGSSGHCPPAQVTLRSVSPVRTLLPAPSGNRVQVLQSRVTTAKNVVAATQTPTQLVQQFVATEGLTVTDSSRRLFRTKGLADAIRELASLTSARTHILSVGSRLVADDSELSCVALGDSRTFEASGVLYRPDIVLTAAHVVKEGFAERVAFGLDARTPRFVSGVIASRILPGYQSSPNLVNDLAVLLLNYEIRGVSMPGLATEKEVVAAVKNRSLLHVVGFGVMDNGQAGEQNEIKVGNLGLIGGILRAGEVGVDSCTGDSGGPGYIPGIKGRVLAGVVSDRSPLFETSEPCGSGGAYQRVDLYAKWINETIDELHKTYKSVQKTVVNLSQPALSVESKLAKP